MKKLISLSFLFLVAFVAKSQQVTVDSDEYQTLKETNQLNGHDLIIDPSAFAPKKGAKPVINDDNFNPKATACDCYVEPDGTYTLAMQPNDDGSSPLINIPFDFCFYGQTYTSFYINNNGNITFVNPMATFSATAFPSAGPLIIAPFWADVDTRMGNGQVLYKITPTAVYVNWEDVGYYSQHGDKLNTFQLLMTDGADPLIESGNVAFCYQDMQWTTGDASGGVNGFGGTPATAGVNKGDNISYFLTSRFDHAGVDFDGALGNPDGISWLDDKSFFFDVCSAINTPPVPEGISSCDTFRVCSYGDTADISINFLSPEVGQVTTITYNNGGLTNMQEIANVSGNTASIILRIIGDPAFAGTYTISVTATDDFVPSGVTTVNFVVEISDSSGANMNPQLTPFVGCDSILVDVLNGPYDTYLWDDFTVDSTGVVDTSGVFGVTVSVNGCYKRVEDYFTITQPPMFNFPPQSMMYCENSNGVFLEITDSSSMTNVSWGLPDPGLDSLYSNVLSDGTYTVTVYDSLGLCSNDTTFTIVETTAPNLIIAGEFDYCPNSPGANVFIPDSLNMSAVSWGISDPVLDAMYSNYFQAGTYTVTATSSINQCESDTSFTIVELPGPSIFADTIACDYIHTIAGTSSYLGGTWSSADTAIHFTNVVADNPDVWTYGQSGVYEVTFTDSICGISVSSTIEYLDYPGTWLVDTVLCNGIVYTVSAPDNNNYPTSFQWDDGTIGTDLVVSEPGGTYIVTMNNVCHTNYDTITIDYKMCDILAPNILSLAQGSQNPLWYVQADGLGEFNLTITNRWGNVIYECNDSAANCYWDGRTKGGRFVEAGTYFYTIQAKSENGQDLTKHGFIQVVD